MTSSHFVLEDHPSDPVAPEKLAEILQLLPDRKDGYVQKDTLQARSIALPFQPEVTLIELTDPGWEPQGARLVFLDTPDGLLQLEGTSPVIHKVNAAHPPKMETPALALAYLSYFCYLVHGEEGPFFILENLESKFLPELPASIELSKVLSSPRIFGRDNAGNWRCSATVWYSNAVFSADFVIEPGGMIRMLNDEPLLTDLPCKVAAPLAVKGRVGGGDTVVDAPEDAPVPLLQLNDEKEAPPPPSPLAPDHVARIAEAIAEKDVAWPFPPVVPGTWKDIGPDETLALLEYAGRSLAVGPLDQPIPVAYGLCRARTRALTCYGDAMLVEARARFPQPGIISFILHRDGVVFLSGKSEPIHLLNLKLPIALGTPEARLDYVRLFMNWVHGEAGRFQLVERVEDVEDRVSDAATLEKLRQVAVPIEVVASTAKGEGWEIAAVLMYDRSAFRARLRLYPNGHIVMEDDHILLEDLAIVREDLKEYHLSRPTGQDGSSLGEDA